jgi:hypothetical protein
MVNLGGLVGDVMLTDENEESSLTSRINRVIVNPFCGSFNPIKDSRSGRQIAHKSFTRIFTASPVDDEFIPAAVANVPFHDVNTCVSQFKSSLQQRQ